MSFEGYDEWLCGNGHLTVNNVHERSPKKCRCGAKFILHRLRDCTNGDRRYPKLKVMTENKCSECGHVKETIYWLPEKGWRKL